MEPKPLVMYFAENTRNPEGGSKVVGHLIQPPPATAMVVFPHRDFADIMDQPGWYFVRLTFAPNGRTAIATPIMDRSNLEVIRDIADVAIHG